MTTRNEPGIDLSTAPDAALFLRLALGAMFIAHGLLKFMVFTPAGTVKFFESIGLPGDLETAVRWNGRTAATQKVTNDSRAAAAV
jgi:uncharacterized membrane protein YphA (DoxX/SURF4 family)